ncbi:MAG: hypothetical protein ACI861_000648 [Paracoccaceae bacterium]|jgi:hypothetical protein
MAFVQGIRMINTLQKKHPVPGKGQGAFIVHGHRLSSLYRFCIPSRFPFIVLKILKKFSSDNLACGASIFGTLKSGAANA